jgi:hypothetical protein
MVAFPCSIQDIETCSVGENILGYYNLLPAEVSMIIFRKAWFEKVGL